MSWKRGIQDIVGKRIAGVLAAERKSATSFGEQQLFLVFSDDTNYEIYVYLVIMKIVCFEERVEGSKNIRIKEASSNNHPENADELLVDDHIWTELTIADCSPCLETPFHTGDVFIPHMFFL